VKEITETMVRSRDTADSAVERVETADQSTHRLSAAAQSMGGIVDLINNITGQISKDIADMRAISSDFVGALGTIKQSIEEVREYVASTAAAVEQQSAVARDVGQHA
jgi:methyl-accepting chemotaxis protein